jgi:3-oxoacyl-[acyl-carrier-protein] synthase-3
MNDPSNLISRCPLRSLAGVQILGTGSFVPDNVVTNADLASLGYDAEWIVQRTGIRERRHCLPDMQTSDMAVAAAERALQNAGVSASDIDLVVLATLSPDYLLPQTASAVQHRLGLNCPAMDVSAACAGFVYALVTASQFVATGCSKRALVIGADCNSRVTDPADTKTYPLFGDGAGAVVLAPGSPAQGLVSYTLGADGAGTELLYRPLGGTRQPFESQHYDDRPWCLKMEGKPVFKWAVRLLEDTFHQVLEGAGKSMDQVDLWVLHQANRRIIDAAVDSLKIDPARVEVHLDRYGNTSAGSVPIALDEARQAGRVQPGHHLMMCGYGAGLSWGTALWCW